ncbi:Protein deltex-4 [Chelonia mydas]|uniref:E3 ubiquitin-protein ligase n=1 Tax=Chelonia mydas TaxID=8469 RepID=M7AX81_CHEMY|nr:Protein deltex-4 [Chelonia mydas]
MSTEKPGTRDPESDDSEDRKFTINLGKNGVEYVVKGKASDSIYMALMALKRIQTHIEKQQGKETYLQGKRQIKGFVKLGMPLKCLPQNSHFAVKFYKVKRDQKGGTIRPVRRSYYDPSSAPGKGVVWEWENDSGSWTAYDMEVGITIQHAYEKQHPWIDLTSIGFCYVIDFSTMGQINRQTQRKRRIRRRLDLVYPLVTGTLPKSQSWPASPGISSSPPTPPCTCPQCLLVMSVKAAVAAGANGGTGAAVPQQQQRKASAPLGGPKPPIPAPGLKPPDGTATTRSSLKTLASQVSRRQAASTPALSSATSPPAANGKTTRASLNTLNRTHLQRLAIAQSRVLIASGVPTVPVKNLNGSSPVNPALAGKTPEEVLKKYLQKVRHPPDEDCTICMERLSTPSGYKGPQPAVKPDLVGKLSKCGHIYHLHCLVAMYNNGNKDGSLQCPTCKTIYGVKTGTQPPGKMEYHLIPHSLPGHPDCKTIRIIYNIAPGVQGPEHPNPGKGFTARGFPRHCYLPDSEKGRKVLKLLLVAWDRRLIFAIGTSSTTGESDTVIWNEIHHKTEFGSNLTGHGYPDSNYLDNVLAELAVQGITEESAAQEKD